eukprot:TRINITY_DN8744_c0_g1_i1.p1 TRINITY_DN8744_c0_g1~~TRINITY_DN8744_c0_g1_i1.p1  ORF type:complete len:160 (-),score=25.22 TRINITY_DN8744_c0_g1_i1:78-557(-)
MTDHEDLSSRFQHPPPGSEHIPLSEDNRDAIRQPAVLLEECDEALEDNETPVTPVSLAPANEFHISEALKHGRYVQHPSPYYDQPNSPMYPQLQPKYEYPTAPTSDAASGLGIDLSHMESTGFFGNVKGKLSHAAATVAGAATNVADNIRSRIERDSYN